MSVIHIFKENVDLYSNISPGMLELIVLDAAMLGMPNNVKEHLEFIEQLIVLKFPNWTKELCQAHSKQVLNILHEKAGSEETLEVPSCAVKRGIDMNTNEKTIHFVRALQLNMPPSPDIELIRIDSLEDIRPYMHLQGILFFDLNNGEFQFLYTENFIMLYTWGDIKVFAKEIKALREKERRLFGIGMWLPKTTVDDQVMQYAFESCFFFMQIADDIAFYGSGATSTQTIVRVVPNYGDLEMFQVNQFQRHVADVVAREWTRESHENEGGAWMMFSMSDIKWALLNRLFVNGRSSMPELLEKRFNSNPNGVVLHEAHSLFKGPSTVLPDIQTNVEAAEAKFEKTAVMFIAKNLGKSCVFNAASSRELLSENRIGDVLHRVLTDEFIFVQHNDPLIQQVGESDVRSKWKYFASKIPNFRGIGVWLPATANTRNQQFLADFSNIGATLYMGFGPAQKVSVFRRRGPPPFDGTDDLEFVFSSIHPTKDDTRQPSIDARQSNTDDYSALVSAQWLVQLSVTVADIHLECYPHCSVLVVVSNGDLATM